MTRATPKIPFVGLHAHSTAGSPFDAIGYPQEHMDYSWENGMDALALTDHGNMNGMSYQVLHTKKMKGDNKIFKPIFGVEAYFIPSISDWRAMKEAKKAEKEKIKDEDELGGAVVEDEESSKKKKNPLNKRSHLILLAQNQTGLNNIYWLVSNSFKPENFYKFPRVDYDMLAAHSEGVIASSACLGGVYATNYWENKDNGPEAVLKAMRETTERMQAIFGKDRWFGELQWVASSDQHALNQYIIQISKEFDLPLISTADSHYPRPELWKDRTLYKKINPKFMSKEEKKLPERVDEIGYELYPKNGDQMFESYQKYAQMNGVQYDEQVVLNSITRTHDIAFNMIESFIPDSKVRLPDFVVPEGETADGALRRMVEFGLNQLFHSKNLSYLHDTYDETYKIYNARIEQELAVICGRGFSKYFLTMKAISDKATAIQLTGPGRGSAAGSLVSYVLGITQVDPIKWGLMFERFLRSDAKDYPDIDYDCANNEAVKHSIIEMWGEDNVASISNWNTLQLSSLIKDIAKFYGIPYQEANNLTNVMLKEAIPKIKEELGIKAGVLPSPPTFEQVLKHSTSLQKFVQDYPQIKDHISNLFRQVKSCGRHAGGLVVGENLPEHMPLIYSGGVRQTPWSEGQNVRHLEPLGFIKFDILGIGTLRMEEDAIRLILKKKNGKTPTFAEVKSFYDENLHPDVIDFDDREVYEDIFHNGKFIGVFQFAEEPMQQFAIKAKPENLVDLSALTSIWRPGPMGMNVHHDYVEVRHDASKVSYIHPIVEECLKETYGFLIFQEQIAALAHKLGKDVSLEEGNLLRKVMTKKGTGKGSEVSDKIHDKFVAGCLEKTISEKDAENLWDKMFAFKQYGFNKSHAVCYSVISFQCAWLLHNYPAEWLCAFLNEQEEEKKGAAIGVAKSMGFEIAPVNVNSSGVSWEPSLDGKTLIQPLNSIKGLGDKAVEQIVEHRPFSTIEDFLFNDKIKYAKLNKKALDVLIRCGACDNLMDSRFANGKHFWMATAFERPKSNKEFKTNIELFKNEDEFSEEEKINNIVDLTGVFPLSMVVDEKVVRRIESKGVPGISQYDSDLLVCWFIPRAFEVKKTKNGKDYLVMTVIDDTCKPVKIKCWGASAKDKIFTNRPYVAKLDYDDQWGFSTRSVGKNFKLVG